MATSSYRAAMAYSRQQTSQCIDPSEMDSWLDFNALGSPSTSNMSRKPSHVSTIASPASTILGPVDVSDEHQTPVQPSHDYRRFRQTTGLPANSVVGLKTISEYSPNGVFADNFDGQVDDFSMPIFDGMSGMGSNTGLGSMGGDFSFADTSSDMPAFFYPTGDNSQMSDFSAVDPTVITKEEEAQQANVRFYPGMHKEQAALQKAQQQAQHQAQQQRQQQLMVQRQQQQGHRGSEDSVYEDTIARALAQIRQNSAMYADDASISGMNSHGRSKKDEDDMDEDERLLNSEEGKKLSSKERRQLRNKVSARAFRSRRKEYITQLEAEIAGKVAENVELKHANRALMGENDAFRALSQVFVSHPAFHSVVAEISRSPDLSAALAKMTNPIQHQQPQQQQQRKDVDPYVASQQIPLPPQQESQQHIGMALMPEPVGLDFSTLNLGGNYMAMQSFQTPQVFAVTEIEVHDAPVFEGLSGKGESALDRFEFATNTAKVDAPALDKETTTSSLPAAETTETTIYDFDASDENVTLFANSPSALPTTDSTTRPSLSSKQTFALRLVSSYSRAASSARLDALLGAMDARFERLVVLSSSFGL